MTYALIKYHLLSSNTWAKASPQLYLFICALGNSGGGHNNQHLWGSGFFFQNILNMLRDLENSKINFIIETEHILPIFFLLLPIYY